jgi:hypothetical protein
MSITQTVNVQVWTDGLSLHEGMPAYLEVEREEAALVQIHAVADHGAKISFVLSRDAAQQLATDLLKALDLRDDC